MKIFHWLILGLVIDMMVGGWVGAEFSYANEVITNEMIPKASRGTHKIMKKQQSKIHDLIDGFLLGNPEVIAELIDEIEEAMVDVAKEFPPTTGKEADQWRHMADVIEQARLVRQASQAGDYRKAYLHFTVMMAQCIECHQERRSWGVFPTVETPEPAEPQQNPPTPEPNE